MKAMSKTLERRRHKRFTVTGKPLAVMSPGPAKPGQVTRISDEAAEILYNSADGSKMADTDELNILVADFARGLYLERIPVKTISDDSAAAGGGRWDDRIRKRVVAFGKLTADQKCQLHSFIASFGY